MSSAHLDLTFVHGCDFTESHLKNAVALDLEIYDPADCIPLEVCRKWRSANPDIYSGIVDSNGVLMGYLNLMILPNRVVKDLISGTLEERLISADWLSAGRSDLADSCGYFASIVVAKALRNSGGAYSDLAIALYLEKLRTLRRSGQQFDQIYGRVVSPQGQSLARRLGFKQTNSSAIWSVSVEWSQL